MYEIINCMITIPPINRPTDRPTNQNNSAQMVPSPPSFFESQFTLFHHLSLSLLGLSPIEHPNNAIQIINPPTPKKTHTHTQDTHTLISTSSTARKIHSFSSLRPVPDRVAATIGRLHARHAHRGVVNGGCVFVLYVCVCVCV
jgi:hypothetical protein